MGFRKWWKKLKIWKKLTIIFIIILIVIFWYVFYLFVTIEGRIVEDRLLLKIVCELRPFCYLSTGGVWGCTGLDEAINDSKVTNELLKWEGYHGCNESTRGFEIRIGESTGREYGQIRGIEHCSCKTIMG